MKWIVICTLFLFYGCAQPQRKYMDDIHQTSLDRYSYLVVGYVGDKVRPHGTGFFYKSELGYKFITAKHSVSGINTFNKTLTPNQYDFLGIVYKDTVTHQWGFIRLAIELVKPMLRNTFFYEEPDMVVFELVGLKLNIAIYAINEMLPKEEIPGKELQNIVTHAYAFPTEIPDGMMLDSVKATYYEGTVADKVHIDPYYPVNSNLYTVLQPECVAGMSGAPMFFKFIEKKNENRIWYEFAGIQFGTNTVYKSGYMITYGTAIAEIIKPTPFRYNF